MTLLTAQTESQNRTPATRMRCSPRWPPSSNSHVTAQLVPPRCLLAAEPPPDGAAAAALPRAAAGAALNVDAAGARREGAGAGGEPDGERFDAAPAGRPARISMTWTIFVKIAPLTSL